MRISSTDNAIYRRLRQLATSNRACREAGRTLVEGVHLLQAASAEQSRIKTLVQRDGTCASEAFDLAQAVARQSGVKLITMEPALYDAISPVEHGAGVLAEIEFDLRAWPQQITGDAVYLHNVQDPGNVGTLLRTAAAAGVRHAITGAGCAFIWSPKVMRAAMGAHFALELYEQTEPCAVREAFNGEIIAADAAGGDDLFRSDWGNRQTLWLFGGEGQGLDAATLAIADRRVRIAIDPGVESLNVAAAAAVCLFEQRRRREVSANIHTRH